MSSKQKLRTKPTLKESKTAAIEAHLFAYNVMHIICSVAKKTSFHSTLSKEKINKLNKPYIYVCKVKVK